MSKKLTAVLENCETPSRREVISMPHALHKWQRTPCILDGIQRDSARLLEIRLRLVCGHGVP